MELSQLVKKLDLQVVTTPAHPRGHVVGGYVSDLLSDVMGNADANTVWITIQAHPNIVAVGVLRDLAGIIIAGGIQPQPQTVDKAKQQGLGLFTTALDAFTVVGILYQLGVKGKCKV